ncbi:MAG: UDP-N-acetylmuramoyl-L-alanyl-D-glutamate--2,6-diaminopimelate ligase [Deltaproteobacteria bacterium]|nr:UDP-N-acetylmuramoyl-L-alanyl-D-glutamate--2,6-diaminopimelate ligase [Deltaproteobacteria bacterium]
MQEVIKSYLKDMQTLKHVLRDEIIFCSGNIKSKINNITSDSRCVSDGSIFVAVRGESLDGHDYILQAIHAGACCIIGELRFFKLKHIFKKNNFSYIQVKNSRKTLALLASKFYDNPSHKMLLIGVTGTSGKTTVTYLLESILKSAGYCVGVIGTINTRYKTKVLPAALTTPDPIELQKTMYEMKASGCDAIVMEVSSHALKQDRVLGLAFDAMAFTNLSSEHLDYHKNMKDYFQAKAKLFHDGITWAFQAKKKPIFCINTEDAYGKLLVKHINRQKQKPKRLYIVSNSRKDFRLVTWQEKELLLAGIRGKIGVINSEKSRSSLISISSGIIGDFNASNILIAIAIAKGLGINKKAIQNGVAGLQSIPGRLEKIPNLHKRLVLVDYAHKPEAMKKVLLLLSHMKKDGRLITVFGCGGDRDRKKRPVMGRYAVRFSDYVIVTSDNPRTENPKKIISEILKGTKGFYNFRVSMDRKKAIHQAVKMSKPYDIILIAGKGHEDYQILADKKHQTRKIHFSDKEVVKAVFRRKII